MGAHRAGPQGRHRAPVAGKRRAARVRPRYGRIAAFGAALSVTAVAVAGGFGLLPSGPDGPGAAASVSRTATQAPVDTPTETRTDARTTTASPLADADGRSQVAALSGSTSLPPASGKGRRVVFSESRQRVWLVDAAGKVVRTYLVSGSLTDNLFEGTYAVYSRSRNAIGIDDSGTMEYFVRFTQGTGGAAIGFHTIPVDDGKPVQTLAQLGTPRSHGCIRQERGNAIALWEFAPIGTTVVVTA